MFTPPSSTQKRGSDHERSEEQDAQGVSDSHTPEKGRANVEKRRKKETISRSNSLKLGDCCYIKSRSAGRKWLVYILPLGGSCTQTHTCGNQN